MADLRIEWDGGKAQANLRKHGVGFDEAETAFSDDYGLILPGPFFSGRGAIDTAWHECSAPRSCRGSLRTRPWRHNPDYLCTPGNQI
jgi:hypothetical protein